MRRFLSPTTHFSLILTIWLATLVSCSSSSVSTKLATWHKSLIGVPRTDSAASSPILHHLPLRDGKVLGYLLTSTTRNILAALDPVGGSVVWRHILGGDDFLEEFRANHDGIMALSGYDVQNVRLLEVKTGNIIWETQLQAPDLDRQSEFRCIGSCIVFATDGTPDVFISSNTGGVHRLNGLTGANKWTWTPVDNAPLTPLSKMIATPTTVFLVNFVESTDSYKIHITAIDSSSGEQVSSHALHSNILDPSSDAIFVGNPLANEATLVWAQRDGARFIRLSDLKDGHSPQILSEYNKVVDLRLGSFGIFVALKPDGSSAILRLDAEDSQWIKTDWSFSDSASSPSRSPSVFAGGFDKLGRPYVSRTFWSNYFKSCSMELYVPHQNVIRGFYYSFDTVQHGVVLHAAMDVASVKDTEFVPRFVITTSTGSFQAWQRERKLWLREEALAHIASAVYVKLPHLGGQNAVVANPMARFISQLGELASSPLNTVVGLSKVIRSVYPSSGAGNSTTLDERFGFRHLIVAATTFGKVLALDSTTGDVVWGQLLSISDVSGQPLNSDMRLLATDTETAGFTSELFIIASAPTDGSSLVFHLSPLTGASLGSIKSRGFASPQHQFPQSVVDAAIVGNHPSRLIMIDNHHNIHSYSPAASQQKLDSASQMTFIIPSATSSHVAGYKLHESGRVESSSKLSARQTWSISFGQDEVIHDIVKPRSRYPIIVPTGAGNETLASNPSNRNLVGIISSTKRSTGMANCAVRVVDGTQGTLTYRAELGAGRCEEVSGVFIGDAFVYSHQDTVASSDSAKGFRITTVDLSGGSKLSANSQPQIQQRTFGVGFQPKFLATTLTKFGIALQDLIVATDRDQIIALPNRFLQTLGTTPQATKSSSAGGPPVSVVQDEPRLTISQIWPVSEVEGILTTSSQLESTSLVFAYGRDLFATTVAPSATFDLLSEDFSRSQLVTTLAVLLVAVLMTRPLAKNRELQRQWFSS